MSEEEIKEVECPKSLDELLYPQNGAVGAIYFNTIMCNSVWSQLPRPLKITVKFMQHVRSVLQRKTIVVKRTDDYLLVSTYTSTFEISAITNIMRFIRKKGNIMIIDIVDVNSNKLLKDLISYVHDDVLRLINNTEAPIELPTSFIRHALDTENP